MPHGMFRDVLTTLKHVYFKTSTSWYSSVMKQHADIYYLKHDQSCCIPISLKVLEIQIVSHLLFHTWLLLQGKGYLRILLHNVMYDINSTPCANTHEITLQINNR